MFHSFLAFLFVYPTQLAQVVGNNPSDPKVGGSPGTWAAFRWIAPYRVNSSMHNYLDNSIWRSISSLHFEVRVLHLPLCTLPDGEKILYLTNLPPSSLHTKARHNCHWILIFWWRRTALRRVFHTTTGASLRVMPAPIWWKKGGAKLNNRPWMIV